jgi:hypothetical protein
MPKKQDLDYYFQTIWRDSKGIIRKAPSDPKNPPKGWKVSRYARSKKYETPEDTRTRIGTEDEKKFNKLQQKKAKKTSFGKLKKDTYRHLRFKSKKMGQYKKIGAGFKPKIGTYYSIAVYEGNKQVGAWKTTKSRRWTANLFDLMENERDQIRFPERQRIAIPIEGDTWRDALSIIRVKGLYYKAKVLINLRLTGILGFEPEYKRIRRKGKYYKVLQNQFQMNHNIVVTMGTIFGNSYDEYLTEKIDKFVRSYCKESNARFTSRETLEEFYDDDHFDYRTYTELIQRDQLTNVSGSVFLTIL